MGFKRSLSSNDYYPTMNRDNVELVMESIAGRCLLSVVTLDGIEPFVDVIVLATGFKPFNITDGIKGHRSRRQKPGGGMARRPRGLSRGRGGQVSESVHDHGAEHGIGPRLDRRHDRGAGRIHPAVP